MNESGFWHGFKKGLPDIDWTKIENSTGSGVPDLNGFYNGRDVWVELKIMSGNQLRFKQSQIGWITRRRAAGARNIFIVARKDKFLYVFNSEVVYLSPDRVDLATKSVFINPFKSLEPMLTLMKPFNWRELREVLFFQ